MSDAFTALQNGFFNAMTAGLNQSASTFQILQPTTPLVASTGDKALWAYLNNIPPYSLTQNYIASGGNQFFSDYNAVVAQMKSGNTIDLEADIGTEAYQDWKLYIRSYARQNGYPSPNQLPGIFRNWASIEYPNVAVIGAQDLAAIALDPVLSAQNALLMYNNNPDWSLTYKQMTDMLQNGQTMSFGLDSSSMNSNVSQSWTHGSNSGFLGLWGSSSSTYSLSEKFASSRVQMAATFDRIITFSPEPGNWYSSAALGMAFANQGNPPWTSSTVTWESTFGANGNMQRFMSNIIIASGMHVKVTSDATLTTEEQQQIQQNSSSGLWPFFCSSSSSGSSITTNCTFENNQLQITIDSDATTPLVIGGNVLPADQFLGHTVAALQMVGKAA